MADPLFPNAVPRDRTRMVIAQIVNRYRRTTRPEEAAGLIHAAQERDSRNSAERDLTVGFLIEVASEVKIVEPDASLRKLAKKVLVRHVVPRVRTKFARERVLMFLALEPNALAGLSARDVKNAHEFMSREWECLRMASNEALGQGLLLKATLEARAFHLLREYWVMEAISPLYALLTSCLALMGCARAVVTHQTPLWSGWSETEFTPAGLRTLQARLEDESQCSELYGDQYRLLRFCGDILRFKSPGDNMAAAKFQEGGRTLLELVALFTCWSHGDPDRLVEPERRVAE